jgi:DNA-binding NarL/FixJ family response regulator
MREPTRTAIVSLRPDAVTTRPRILLVDDHVLMLDALEALLANEWNVIGKICDPDEVIDAVETLHPDIVVLDVVMPRRGGFELAREITQRFPSTKLVFVTMNEDAYLAAEAFRIGASAYVLKGSAASELSTAMRVAVEGSRYITSSLTGAIVQTLLQPQEPISVALAPRQEEVLRLLAKGYSMKEVAAAMNITTRTVALHKYQMMAQLRIKSSAELIRYAVQQRIV